ncbi:MAG: hypothetical protein D6705_15695 [Deltaproteobacteria bacterium]|nr:MAG: hypothetical protein D6705_15695 [Deltaproteobacteria bacterium]
MLRRLPAIVATLGVVVLPTLAEAADGGFGGFLGPPRHYGAPCPGGGPRTLAFVSIFGAVVVLVAWMRLAAENRRLDVVRRLVEAGRDVPPQLLTGTAIMDLRRGIVLMAAGVGLVLAGWLVHSRAWAVGIVPACIGMGYLVSYRLGLRRTFGDARSEERGA